ncbi:MAG: CheR family methyltransferase [Gallionella sp.]|jgi:chemotaxis protein methyltransferase CheR
MEEALLKKTRNLIANRIGLLVREQDDAMLRRVVAERVRALNLSGAEQYCQYLETDAGVLHEREELVIPFTTGETYFFRDSGLHALLHDEILPELIERRKEARALRIWCAACATGEEVYSLAILLDELLSDQLQWNIFILGTDINRHAIEKARRGIYTDWSFRGMSCERRQRYFECHKNTWVLDDRIRSRVTFQTGDLVSDAFPDHAAKMYDMDLILCRNAFIYMAPNIVSHIADKFAETLADGGILIVGHGELYAHHLGKLRPRVFPEAIVYQKVVSPLFSQPPTALVKTDVPEKLAGVLVQKTRAAVPVSPPQAAETGQGTSDSEMLHVWELANQGQREMAAKSCSEMIDRNPLDAEPYYLMALLAQERGDFAQARDLLKKVIYLAPSFIAAYLDLGDLYAREGESARAVKMRTTARDLLKRLPADQQVKLYGAATVDKVLEYVEHLLSASEQ